MGALFDAELKIDAVMFGGSGRKRMREKKPPIASLLQRWRTDDDWRTEIETDESGGDRQRDDMHLALMATWDDDSARGIGSSLASKSTK